jgi:hypothetical protein
VLARDAYGGFFEEGLIYAAVESRFRTVALVAGSLPKENPRGLAEVNPANFAPHISAPVLMLNGRYDEVNPLRTRIEPLFKLLREPKRMFLYDSGHSLRLKSPFPSSIPGWMKCSGRSDASEPVRVPALRVAPLFCPRISSA